MTEKTKNLLIRTASGSVMFAFVLAATLLNNMYVYAAFVLSIAIGATLEFFALSQKCGAKPSLSLGLTSGILIIIIGLLNAFNYWESEFVTYAIVAFVVLIPLSFMVLIRTSHNNPIASVGATLVAPLYIALPLALMSLLPFVYSEGKTPWDGKIILAYILIVWANDVFAYLFGVAFGKHKMCPKISPKKSWEGFVGGIMSACGFGVLMGWWLQGNLLMWGIFGLLVALSGVLGDLVESMFKRAADVKDSGNIMPGHGGWLDRFDAMFLSAPIAFVIILIFNLIK